MKGLTDIRGLRDVRGMPTTGRRAIPRTGSSAYLDLYVLQRERERLLKEAGLLAKRDRAIRKRLSEIAAQVEALGWWSRSERPGDGGGKAPPGRPPMGKRWKTLPLRY